MSSPDLQLHEKTQTDLFQNYHEIPERRAESLIGGKRYQTSVLKHKDVDLGGFRRFFEGLGLFILTAGTLGFALISDRVRDSWLETLDGRSVKYVKTPISSIDRRMSSSSIPLLRKDYSSSEVGSIEMPKKENTLAIIKGKKGSAIDALLTDKVETLHFSGSVRIVKNGAVILQKGYGIASGDRSNSPETIFRLASLSKSLTVAAIMRLYDKKLVKLNDPISNYLPFVNKKIENLKAELVELLDQQSFGSPDIEEIARKIKENQKQIKWLGSITIEHLIKHQSGLPDLIEAAPESVVSFQLRERSPKDYIDKLQDKPVKFEPGTEKRYNNFGYMLLAQIIEKVSGKSYEFSIKDEILTPLEMHATYCPIRKEDDYPEAQAFTLVQFKLEELRHYIEWLTGEIEKDLEGDVRLSKLRAQKSKCEEELARLSDIPKNTKVAAEPDDCSVRVGSGNVNSSILDLAKFEEALSKTAFLSKEAQSLMSTKGLGWDLYGKQAEEAILGEEVEGNRGWVMKDGELGGGHTVMWRFPDKQASITMLCNSDMNDDAHGYLGPLSIEISKLLLAE